MPETRYFVPRNWHKFQNASKPNAKWVKLHKQLLRDHDFMSLTEIQQCHLMKLWMLYGDIRRPLPWDCGWIARQLQADCRTIAKTLKALLSSDFIELAEKSVPLATRDTETETETETEKDLSNERSKVVENDSQQGGVNGHGYAFEGKVIRLNHPDFEQWRKAFHAIPDLHAQLCSMDEWYAKNLKPAERKDWFSRASTALNNKHQKFMAEKPGKVVVLTPEEQEEERRIYERAQAAISGRRYPGVER